MTEEPERNYLHGDQKEGNPEMWFCRRCDHFVPEAHFSEGHHKKQRLSEYEKYLDEKKRFPIKMKNQPSKWRRPDNAPNHFA